MNYTKREFDRFILKHGHVVIVAHSEHKLHCDCYDPRTDKGDKDCVDCFGTGWLYNWFYTKTRRSKLLLEQDKLESHQAIDAYTTRFKYFFKSEVPIAHNDFIFEIQQNLGRNTITQYRVGNLSPEIGEDGQVSFQTVIVSQELVNQQVIRKKITEIKQSNLKVV